MANLNPVPGWDSVPELETTTEALGGPGAPMNTQAQALLDRTEQLNPDNLPSHAGSYNGSEIFTMKVGTSWVQGQVSDLVTYLYDNVSISLAPPTATFDLVGYCMGVLVAAQPVLKAITPQAITLPAGLTGSYAYCDTAPTTDVSCAITRLSAGATTTVGSANFAAGSTTGTFTFTSDVVTLPGDVIAILAPVSVDPTFAGPAFGLSASITVAVGYVMLKVAAYTPITADRNGLLVMNATSPVTNTLPAATGYTGSFPNGWRTSFINISAGIVTLAVRTGVSLNGVVNGTFALANGQGATVWTDGTNWFALSGV